MSQHYYKVVLVGDSGVGKSNLYERYVHDRFLANHAPTIGSDFSVTNIDFGDEVVSVHIWDTAGQERFHSITNRIYMKGANGVILTYDVTRRSSFEKVAFWRRLVESCESVGPNLVYILVGNKCDLLDQRTVTHEEGLEEANKHSMLYTETSAKSGDNVIQAFHMIAAEIHKRHREMDDYWENWKHRTRLITDIGPAHVEHSACCQSS